MVLLMTELQKRISFIGLVALGAAGVIGTSWIYTNSKFFAAYGAGGEIFGFVVATVIASLIALAYAELSTVFPRAGGEVVYTYVAFGKTTSFIAGWALVGAYLASLAFYVTASSLLLAWIFPQLEQGPYYVIAGTKIHLPELIVGIAITLLVFLVNYYGAHLASGIQIVMFGTMIVLGLLLVIVGFTHGQASNFWPAWSKDMNPFLSTMRFVLPAMTYLTGFELVAVLAEEANMPVRKIGISVILSVVLAGLFYTIVLLSSAWVIPWQETAKLKLGTIDAFKVAGFPALGWAAYFISVLGLVTSFVGLFAATPRLILSLSRAGVLPQTFTKTHPKYGTPVNALYLTLGFALGLGWLGKGAMVWFLDMGGFAIAIAWVLATLSLIKIRKKYPNLRGAYRTSATLLPLIGGIVAIIIAIATLIPGTPLSLAWPYEYIVLGVWAIVGVILYAKAPKGNEEEALKNLLGEYYEAIKKATD
ncbi:MAG: Amino acid transporter [Caldanaerobacter subterraneus]|jgi:amino acid transporter|uniref:Amino acid transporter n=2 Tax=Caldanaerobacter subterraneus TaxID=911092 RepID=A0A101E527_9THEO|nr:MAG: Amino acid transporter [Caldanaerobacter subterraneus]HBT48612.1 amino acid transporter [Caldanaerobacter subterraneus]